MKTLDYLLAAKACIDQLSKARLELTELSDFDLVGQVIEDLDKPYLTPVLAPNNHDFTEANSFWLVAWDDMEPAMLIGARLEMLGDEPIDAFWKRTSRRHYPSGQDETIESVAPQISKELSGRLVYIGDLFIRQQNRGSREVLDNFMLLAHVIVGTKWNPDHTYAFMRDRDVRLGFANRYGFTRHLPWAREWVDPPYGRDDSEWLVSLSRADRDHTVLKSVKSVDDLRVVEDVGITPKVVHG